MNILIGFLIGVVCLGIPMILQYRKYVQSIRAVSDKWKGINDDWQTQYNSLYDAWIRGITPNSKAIAEYDGYATRDPKRVLTQSELDDASYRLRNWREHVSPARIDSATKDKSQ